MKVLISGTWRSALAKQQEEHAQQLGKLLAEQGVEILTGGGEGIPELVSTSYTQHGGKKHTAILVDQKVRERVGEKLIQADEYVNTSLDYPQRNALLVSKADAIIAMNGRLGTLTELIHATNDYEIPAILLATSEIKEWVLATTPLKEKVVMVNTPQEAITILQNQASLTSS